MQIKCVKNGLAMVQMMCPYVRPLLFVTLPTDSLLSLTARRAPYNLESADSIPGSV